MEIQEFKKLKTKTILLVEDESIIRNNIASMLKYFFKDVYTAADGYDGLDKYEKYLPDIVMTDLKMPFMGGFELINELKKRSSSSYMIVVSAHTDTDLLINAVNNGIDRYIVKPVTESQIFDAFNAFLEIINNKSSKKIELAPTIIFEVDTHHITVNNKTIHLNKKETLLLKLLAEDKNKIFTYDEIENKIWGGKSMSLAALRSVVRDLRKKSGHNIIQNISGVGYKL